MSHRPFIIGNSVWATTVAFQQLFKDMEARNVYERYGAPDQYHKALKVPVTLDTKERIYHKLLHGGHKELEEADTRLPRLAIQLDNINPNVERYTGKDAPRILSSSPSGLDRDIQPYPVTIDYTVSLWAKYYDHFFQLIENILPWFDPYVTVGIKERNLGIERELVVRNTGVTNSSNFVMTQNEQRIIRGEMTFTVETYMYKVRKTHQPGDRITKADILVVDVNTPITSEIITISAGSHDPNNNY